MLEFIIGSLIGQVLSYTALRVYLAATVRRCLSYTTFKTPCEVCHDVQLSGYFWNGLPVRVLAYLVDSHLQAGARKKKYVDRSVLKRECYCPYEYCLSVNVRRRQKKTQNINPEAEAYILP